MEKARQLFEEELSLADIKGFLDSFGHSQYGLARVHEADGRTDLALPLAQDALKIYRQLQHKDFTEVQEFVDRLKKA